MLQSIRAAGAKDQSPSPGSAEKYFSNLPFSPLCASASSGGAFWLRGQLPGCSVHLGDPVRYAARPGRFEPTLDAAFKALVLELPDENEQLGPTPRLGF